MNRRRLPHLYVIGQPLFVTFRLYGSLPKGKHFRTGTIASGEAFASLDRILDAAQTGPTWLRLQPIAQLVKEAILIHNPHAWVIMPNHVHLLFTPAGNPAGILQSIKGTTARAANQYLERTGRPFWQNESYDHLVRNAMQFTRIENYIHHNPVRAALAASAEQYPWSSANPAELKLRAG